MSMLFGSAGFGASGGVLAQIRLGGSVSEAPIYYVSATGSDSNDGLSVLTPWQTLAKVNATTFNPGESVLFKGGDSFSGQLIPMAPNPLIVSTQRVTFGSYGTGQARITNPANVDIVVILNISRITLSNLEIDGVDAANGVYIGNDNPSGVAVQSDITVFNCNVHDCVSTGISLGSDAGLNVWNNVLFDGVTSYNNVGHGIFAYAQGAGVKPMTNVTARNCLTHNNGQSGILFGGVNGGLIENCVAHHNGALAIGPYGIWMYDCAGVTIQYCESYLNTSSTNADGGGFDIDGGCLNCVIQYCYSHDNKGAGYLCWAYNASTITNCIFRFNISLDDGSSAGDIYGALTIGGTGTGQIVSGYAYNNVFYNTLASRSTVYVANTGTITAFKVSNNVIYGTVKLVESPVNRAVLFQGNSYSGIGTFTWNGVSYSTLAAWQAAFTTQEKVGAANVGITAAPWLIDLGAKPTIGGDGYEPIQLNGYRLATMSSPLVGGGVDLATLYGLTKPTSDYFGAPANAGWDVGISFSVGTLAAPANTVAPALTGAAVTGQTLTAGTGTWTGSPPIGFTYQWQRNGSNIGGQTASTYLLDVADEGQSIRCVVTATNDAGNASANSNAVTPAAGGSYDADATAWFSAVVTNGGTDPDGATKQIVSDFYAGLKTDGLYTLIDRMNLVAAHDAIGARLDLKDKTSLLTLSVAPTFTAFRGYQGNGTSQFINTNWNSVSPAGNFAQNSGGITTYLNATASDVGSSTASIARITSVISFIRPRLSGTNVMEGRMMSASTKAYGAMGSRLGFRSISRTASNITRGYGPDGLQSGTDDTTASVALVNENFTLLRLQNVYSNDRIAFWAAHGGLDATQTLNLRNRVVTMLTALGAN